MNAASRKNDKPKVAGSEYVTIRQAAAELGVSDQTIHNWMSDKKNGIQFAQFGERTTRIVRASWERFKAQKVKP